MNDNRTAHASSEYDGSIEKTIPFYAAIHDEVINLVSSFPTIPMKWLDTGCGTGTLLMKAKQRFPNTSFFVCDPSPEMLAIALNKLGGEAESLGAIDTASISGAWENQFDVITAIQCLHYLDAKGREDSIRRCHDLLKEDGLFLTFENTRALTAKGEEVYKNYWKHFQIDSGKDPVKAEAHILRYGVEYFPISVLDHIDLLRRIGFATVELFWYSYMQSGYLCIK